MPHGIVAAAACYRPRACRLRRVLRRGAQPQHERVQLVEAWLAAHGGRARLQRRAHILGGLLWAVLVQPQRILRAGPRNTCRTGGRPMTGPTQGWSCSQGCRAAGPGAVHRHGREPRADVQRVQATQYAWALAALDRAVGLQTLGAARRRGRDPGAAFRPVQARQNTWTVATADKDCRAANPMAARRRGRDPGAAFRQARARQNNWSVATADMGCRAADPGAARRRGRGPGAAVRPAQARQNARSACSLQTRQPCTPGLQGSRGARAPARA